MVEGSRPNALNRLLVEFEFLVDLDIGLFRFIKSEANNPDLVDQDFISKSDDEVLTILSSRSMINPLELFINGDSTELYKSMITDYVDKLYKYAGGYDSYRLMVTYYKMHLANITILCENDKQSDYIRKITPYLKVLVSSRDKVDLYNYDSIYMKYFINSLLYKNMDGKHIYIYNCLFNMDIDEATGEPLNVKLSIANNVIDTNIVHLIELYKSKRRKGEYYE